MGETSQVERAARRAIARAKERGDAHVTPDDMLTGALAEISRLGIAWVGPWPLDVRALSGDGCGDEPAGSGTGERAAPAYAPDTVELLERAATLAREDGATRMGLVHLLAASGEVEDGLMDRLRREHGFSEADWRAELARGVVGSPPGIVARSGGGPGAGGDGGAGAGVPEVLSVDEAAGYLDVHSQTVRNYIRSGKLPAYRLAGERYIRVLRRDLLTLLERVRAEAPEESEETIPATGGT